MSELKISYFGNKIEIKGDIEIFNKPKLRHWLKTDFERDFSDNSKIILLKDEFLDSDFLYKFQKSIIKKLKTVNIKFDNAFNDVVDNEINDQQNFIDFSNEAKAIWENKYNVEEFEKFCNIIEQKLKNRRLLQITSFKWLSYVIFPKFL